MNPLCEISSNHAKEKAGYSFGFNLMKRSARLNNTCWCVLELKVDGLFTTCKVLMSRR